MKVVAGVDGGGTRTRALLVDGKGVALGRGEGPAGLVRPGRAGRSARAVQRALERARDAAGFQGPLEALWVGLAGAGREEARRQVRRTLEELELARRVRVGTDVEGAYRDAFAGDTGILLVAGTGSMALARGPDGAWVRVGGWGALLGDEGSGYWIGVRALRAVLAAHDGRGAATDLTAAALEAFDVAGPRELVDAAAEVQKAEIASLAARVSRAAESGDAVAEGILSEAVEALLAHLRAARWRLGSDQSVPLALSGGLLNRGRPLRGRLEAALPEGAFALRSVEVRPTRGAATLAREMAGL